MIIQNPNKMIDIEYGKRLQLVLVISLLIFIFILDSYAITAYPESKSILILLKTFSIPVLCVMIFRFAECQKYLLPIDFFLLIIVNVALFTCALTTGTLVTGEYIWASIFSTVLICIVPVKHCYSFKFSPNKFKLVIFILNITFAATLLWNIDFWILQNSRVFGGVNSNAACAYAGLCLTFIAGIFRTGNLTGEQKKSLKTTTILLFLSVVSSNSRSGVIWILVSFLVFTDRKNRHHTFKRISIIIISLFYFSSVCVTSMLLTNNQDAFIPLLEQMTALRPKGEIGSDINRLRYSDVVFNYLGNDRVFAGAGFGKRDYRDTLGEGEDVHNAFLTTLSDSGYIGSFIMIFLCFFWPIIRSGKSSSMRPRNFFLSCILSSASFFPAPIYGNQYFSVAILYCSLLWLDPESKKLS